MKKRIAILALQGAVEPHKAHLEAMNCEWVPVKTSEEISDTSLSGMIIPGGESSTMLKLISVFGLEGALRDFAKSKPVWGVCAGSILMAKEVQGVDQISFAFLDFSVKRNAYGSQLESFVSSIEGVSEAVFIRAPQFENVSKDLKVLASHNEKPVWLCSDSHMATSFHPELSTRVPSECHEYFVSKIINNIVL